MWWAKNLEVRIQRKGKHVFWDLQLVFSDYLILYTLYAHAIALFENNCSTLIALIFF